MDDGKKEGGSPAKSPEKKEGPPGDGKAALMKGKTGAGGPPGGFAGKGPGGPPGAGAGGPPGAGGPAGGMRRAGALSSIETKAEGSISWTVYKDYIKSGGGCYFLFVMFLFVFAQGARIFSDWWLTAWSTDLFNLHAGYYVLYYGVITIGSLILIFLRSWIYGLFSRKSSIILQRNLIYSIFRSPISWFDTTPSGRILNRASKDQDDVDSSLPWAFQNAMQNLLSLIATLILVGIVTYWFFILAAVAGVIYFYIVKIYLKASRELKRIGSITRSPALMTISESSTGYMVIRAFGHESYFEKKLSQTFDVWVKANMNQMAVQRWIGIRSDIFAAFIVGGAALFAVLTRVTGNYINPGLVGLSLSYALQISSYISFTVRLMAEAEL